MNDAEAFRSLAWVLGLAALAPLVLAMLPRVRLPEVVILLALGMAIGPYGLDLARAGEQVSFVSQVGLGMLFLLAGMEVDPLELRSRDGVRATTAWLVTLVAALVWMLVIGGLLDIPAWAAISIAMTSTALGTMLPLLRDSGLHRQPVGRLVLVNGAIGELGPILAMSVFLSQRSAWGAVLSLTAFAVLVLLSYLLVRHSLRLERLLAAIRHGAETTAQAPVRLVMLLLVLMLAMAATLDLDVILGAFVAGAIIRQLLPPEHSAISARLDGIGYGFLVPVFFVVSGMGIDPVALVHRPGEVLFVFGSILVLRGVPVVVAFRHLERRARIQLGLFSATGLPIIVAVTSVAVADGQMTEAGQSIVIGAGMLTVLLLPTIALSLHARRPPATAGS